MGMKADGNLYIAAQFLDTFDEIGKQVEKGAAKISNNTKIDLSLDEKNILKEINSMLGSTKFKDLDLSDIVSSVFASISKEGMSSKDRTKILDDFQYNLRMFHTAPLKTIKQLKGVKSEDLTGILQEIQTDSLSDNPKRQWTSSNLKNNIKEIIDEHLKTAIDNTVDSIQETLVQEFGKDTAKYGVSGKEANNRLNNIYDSLVEKAKEQSKIEGNNVGLDEIVTDNELKSIQGFYSRIESLGEIASDKAKKLADMLTSMSNDGAIEEGLDDIIYQISEDVNSFTEREKQLIQETKQQQKEIDELNAQNKSSSRQKIKPNFNVENQEQDTTSTIFQSVKKENKIQETKTQQQENKKIIEQANEITATESKTVDIKKQQTQEIEKQNNLLKEQKQIEDNIGEVDEYQMAEFEAKMNKIAKNQEVEKQKKIEEALYGQQTINDKRIITELTEAEKKWKQSKKDYSQAVKSNNFLALGKASTDQDINYLNYLRTLAYAKQNHPDDKRLERFKTEIGHSTLEDIDDEIEDIEESLQKTLDNIRGRINKLDNQYSNYPSYHEQSSLEEDDSSMAVSQDQVQQEIQETTSTAQSAVKSNEQLAESVQEVTQAVQQEGQAMSNSSIDDYLVKWIEMVRGTKAYSGMEERGVALKGTEEVFPVKSGKLHYERGHVGGGVNVTGFEDKADTLLHSHTYSKEVDNLRFSWADLETGFDTIVQNMDTAVTKMFLSCGDEIASIDVTGMSSETARLVESQLHEMYNSALILFGGEINNKGVAGKIGISDELMNQATNLMNTMMKGIIEQAGGSVKFLKLADNKLIDNTSARTNFRITPEIANRLKEIQNISNLSVSEASDEEIAQKLRDFQIRNGIKTNTSGLLGLSPEQLEEVDKLLLQIFNHKQQLENAKAGSRMAASIQEKIDEAEKRIAEITKISNKDIQQQVDKKISEEKVDVVPEKETDNSQEELEIVEKIEEVENNIVSKKEKRTEEIQKQNDILQQQEQNESNIKEQNEDVVNKKEEAIEKTKEELQTEQQLTNELKEQKNIEQTSGETSKEDKKEAELQTIKEIKEETQQVTEQQQKVAEAKQETLQATQEELKTEQQLSAEVQNQEKAEEKKTKVTFVHNGKKLPDVQRHGKTQTEINAQIKAEEEKKKKKSSTPKSDLEEKKRVEEIAAADAKEEEIETINNLNFMAALNAKLAEAEAQQAEKEAQKIQLTSERMQVLKQGIQDATESLKEYKEIDEQIVKLQSDKDAYVISPSTQNEMMQAGVLSSSIDMAEYIRSAYRTYKKTGNEADEKVLKEALRQYMLPTGKKNGEYTYRDDKYLYSKNGKELKSYTKDKDFKSYIKQAQDEETAYEKAQRKLPTLLDQKKSGQQSFVEISAKIQQLLQEAGLDAEKVNEILAAINGNLTNEEAIWKVINSYIKEATQELVQQEAQTEITSSDNLVTQQEKNQESIQETIDKTKELNSTLEQSVSPSILSKTPKPEKEIPKILKTPEISEDTLDSAEAIKEESNSFKEVEETADKAAKAKNNFVNVNKSVKKSAKESTPLIKKESTALENTPSKSEVTLKDVIKENTLREKRGIKSSAEKWINSGITTDRIERLRDYRQRLSEIEKEISNSSDQNKIAQLNTEYKNLLSTIKILVQELNKANSKENAMLKSQQQQVQINKSLIDNRASLANEVEKKLNKGYYDSTANKYNKILSQYSPTESPEAGEAIGKANEALDKYTLKISELKKFSIGELQLDYPFEQLIQEINKAELEVGEFIKNVQDNFSKIANSNSVTDFATRIRSILDTYKRITPESKQKLENIFGSLTVGKTTTKQLADARTQLKSILTDEKELGNLSSNLFDRMYGKMQEGLAFLATKVSVYEIFNQFRQGLEIIHQFDDALTEMMKVSDETRLSLERYQKTTFDTADAIGTSALQLQNSTADFMRLGETLDQAAESAKTANVLMNVSEFQSIDEATKSLIAMSAAYDDLSKMNIIDKLNEVGNNYAISTSEAAEALQSSASALQTAGNDMDEALALITAGNAVVQDANKVGAGMRTIALRLTGKAMCPNIE